MKRIVFSVWSGFLVLTFGCATVWAQATAQISGTAKDQSGAVLPGVEITVTQTDTGTTRMTITNETGSYALPNLPLGPYRLEAALPGFRTYVQSGIVLQVNSSPALNVVLEVGQVAETVEVQANAALVETRNSTLGSVIENERILELPLNGRNVTDLITLAGGAVSAGEGRGASLIGGASPQISVAGGTGFGVDYTLDGANHISFVTGSTMVMPFPDAMQEFKVETSGVNAQRGNSTAVAAVTKSGTNEFHGNLFEFVRNDLFNARSYFATTHSTLKRNQFGGTVGGPIVRNKLFFFGGYQDTTLRQDPADTRVFVPTPAIMAGDWTAFTSPACNAGRQIALRAPFVNNRIDPALYSNAALFVVRYRGAKPFPTTNDPCGQITYGSMLANNEGNYVGKVDYQQSPKHSLFGRVFFQTFASPDPKSFNSILLQDTGWRSSMQSSYILGSTYLVSSNTVQALRLAVNRTANHYFNVGRGELFDWCDAGVKIYCAPEITRINNMSITGGFPLTSGFFSGMKYVGNSYSLNDDVSLFRGAHQISFGVNATQGRENAFSSFSAANQFSFSGGATGIGLADFMVGRPSQFLTAKAYPHHVKGTTVAVYGTDAWKATQKLTLNYGVRWEPFLPQNAEFVLNFDYDRFRQGIKSGVFPNAPAGMYYRGDPGFPKDGVNKRWLQFAPRLGLAWDVRGNGRTSVRASYGLGYVYVPGDFRETYSAAPPFGNRVVLASPPGGLEDPWRGIPGGNPFPYEIGKNAPFTGSGAFYTQRYDLKPPYSQSWNLSIQRQIGMGWLMSTSYMGSNIMHVWSSKALNPAVYIPGGPCTLNGVTYNPCSTANNTDARRRFTLERPADGEKLGYMADADDGGTQIYHGMLLSIERRAAKGITVSGNYTWSHCIGPYAAIYTPMAPHPQDTYAYPNNRDADRGNCDSDRRQQFNFTSVAETPQFSNPTLRVLATGWRFSGIYRLSSGIPLTVTAGSDRALTGTPVNTSGASTQRTNQVLGNPYGDKSAGPLSGYLNPAAFTIPDMGTNGAMSRNNIQGPKTWSFDLAASRVFRFRESQRLELRAEAYNVTNSFRPGNPNTALNNNTFGVIRTSLDPRILQFALKYVF